MIYKAVIFDLDGTLLDSIKGIAESANLLLKKKGYSAFSLTEYKKFVGDGLERLVYRILPDEERDKRKIYEYVQEYRMIYKKNWLAKTKVFKGIRELLEVLSEKKIKKAVLSNKSDGFVKIMVEKLLSKHYFDIIWGDRPGVPRKPDSQAALEISRQFGVNPEQVLFVGDSGIDMKTAKNAGMVPVGVSWGLREVKELLDHGAGRVINRPVELLDFFT